MNPEDQQPEEEITPIAPDQISSLSARRAEEAPAPDLTVVEPEAVEEVQVVDHYAVEELHPAPVEAVAPPPDMHAVETDAPAAEQAAMELTGTVTARAFTQDDIKAMQANYANQAGKEKLSALTVAIVVHAAVFFILGLIVIAVPRQAPPEIVAVASPSDEVVPEIEKKEVQKVTKPNPSAASRVNVLTVANTSNVAVPVVIDPIQNIEPIGAGADFGMAMNFSADGAGNVSFFGSATKANKVVFVVDSSASMRSSGKTGKTKHELMKEELSKTVKGLSSGVQFQIIFFTGPSWYVGEDWKEDRANWKRSPKGNFWSYGDGSDEAIRTEKLRQATPSTIRRTIKEIEETPIVGGTDWRVPLKMAMKLEPDVIYFMTDGAVGKDPDKPPVVQDLLKFNKEHSNAKINSICLMVPKAMEDMGELSKQTRGELTLVLEDGTPLRGRELEKHLNK